jgi:hypothetical protein
MLKKLHEDGQDRSQHVGALMDCVLKYNFNISALSCFIIWNAQNIQFTGKK